MIEVFYKNIKFWYANGFASCADSASTIAITKIKFIVGNSTPNCCTASAIILKQSKEGIGSASKLQIFVSNYLQSILFSFVRRM